MNSNSVTVYFISAMIALLSTISSLNELVAQSAQKTLTHEDSSWFEIRLAEPKTYVIQEPHSSQGNVSYLIVGDSISLMFDTGTGENRPIDGTKIKHLINKLSSVPTTLLLSHFHFDHNQNISEFETVAFPDMPFLRRKVTTANIYSFTESDLFEGNHPSKVHIKKWLPLNTDIDLGNRIIQLLNIPGHTVESIAIIDKTNKMAFLGDFLYNGALYLFSPKDLLVYRKSLDRLVSTIDKDYRLFGAHGKPEIDFSFIHSLYALFDCIDLGECVAQKQKLWGRPVSIYRKEKMRIVVFQ